MKNKLSRILMLAVVLLAVSISAFATVQPTFTTLSAAVADERATRLTVTSATGFVASTGTLDYGILIDHEFMRITAVSGTTITVMRNQASTTATAHKSGATVLVGQYGSQQAPGTSGGPFIQTVMNGSCTSANYPILPLIQVNANQIGGQTMYNCLGGVWQKQGLIDDQLVEPIIGPCNIEIGSVAYASVGTNTTDIANKRMTTSIIFPRTGIFTGIQVLQGGTATTDNITTAIYDSAGKLIASSAAAGTLLATANTFKSIAFALGPTGVAQTKTIITGPALYFISVTGNGTAAGAYQTVPASTFKNVFTQGTTSITFGTFPAFTPPTTFTADLGPVVCAYN